MGAGKTHSDSYYRQRYAERADSLGKSTASDSPGMQSANASGIFLDTYEPPALAIQQPVFSQTNGVWHGQTMSGNIPDSTGERPDINASGIDYIRAEQKQVRKSFTQDTVSQEPERDPYYDYIINSLENGGNYTGDEDVWMDAEEIYARRKAEALKRAYEKSAETCLEYETRLSDAYVNLAQLEEELAGATGFKLFTLQPQYDAAKAIYYDAYSEWDESRTKRDWTEQSYLKAKNTVETKWPGIEQDARVALGEVPREKISELYHASLENAKKGDRHSREENKNSAQLYGNMLAQHDMAAIIAAAQRGGLPDTAEYILFELKNAANGQPYEVVETESGKDTVGESAFLSKARKELKKAGYTVEEIDNFVSGISGLVDASLTERQTNALYNLAQRLPISTTVISSLLSPWKGLALLEPYGQRFGHSTWNSLDTNSAMFAPSNAINTIRGAVRDRFDLNVGRGEKAYDIFDDVYGAAADALDFIVARAAGGKGPKRSGLILGSETIPEVMRAVANRGGTADEAAKTALLTTGVNALLETYVFNNFNALSSTAPESFMKAVKGIAKQGGLEAAQSAASKTADYLIDMLSNGDASEYEYAAAQYMEQHPEASAQEAKKAALAQKAKEIAGDAASAFGTGVLTGSAATVGGYLKNTFMDTPSEYTYGDWPDDATPDGRTHFDASDIESDEIAAENDGEMHKSGGVAVAEKGETENASTNDTDDLISQGANAINADIYHSTPFFEGDLIDDELMQWLEDSGVKFTKDKVLMTAKTPKGDVRWLEEGNDNVGLKHIWDRHGDELSKKGIPLDKIPYFLKYIIQELEPYEVGTNGIGPYADYCVNNYIYKMSHGTNGFIVSLYPYSNNK